MIFQRANTIMSIYPEGHKAAAVIPLLDLAQRQIGISVSSPYLYTLLDILFCLLSLRALYFLSDLGDSFLATKTLALFTPLS